LKLTFSLFFTFTLPLIFFSILIMSYHQDYYQQHPHQAYYQDDYAMQPMSPHHNDGYYAPQHEYNTSNLSTPMVADDHGYAYADTKRLAPSPMIPQQSYFDKDDDDGHSQHERTCCGWFCCGCCCGCCPLWLRWCSCGLLIIFLAFGITIGVLAALFKQPQVNFNGITLSNSTQAVQINGTGFNINFNLNIGVVNPNIESATFTSVKAIVSSMRNENIVSVFPPINPPPHLSRGSDLRLLIHPLLFVLGILSYSTYCTSR
jgi:hypothetical protein